MYGKNAKLKELANLVVVAGYNDAKKSSDREEISEIEKMHALIKQYDLDGHIRWISAQTNRARNGELYRYIADKRGIFVQVTCLQLIVYYVNCSYFHFISWSSYMLISCLSLQSTKHSGSQWSRLWAVGSRHLLLATAVRWKSLKMVCPGFILIHIIQIRPEP